MWLLILSFCVLLQCYSSLAQASFSQPTSEEVIMGGIPFIVTVYESLTAPYFSQMTDMNLLLLSGGNTSPMNLYSWYLNDTNPSTVSNSIIFPPSIGPNASNAYFLGISGTLKSNTSVYATFYSTRFTLMNMTGTQSLDAYTAGQFYTGLAGAPTLLVSCGEPTGASCNPPELKALSTAIPSYPIVSAGLGLAAPVVTSPPVGTAYASSTNIASFRTITSAGAQPTITATNTPLGSSPTSTIASPASSSSTASTTTSKMLPAMVYPVIIAGLSLTAACVLFYTYTRYRRSHHGMMSDCEKIALQRKWWDRMPMRSVMRRSRVVELDAEKAAEIKAVELEGERTREELGGQEKGTRFELDGGLGSIKKVVDVVVTSERVAVVSDELVAGKVDEMVVMRKETVTPRKGNVKRSTKAVPVQRDLPPLPTDQGKPACRKEETKDYETKREVEAQKKRRGHYSVGPDGAYNYR